MIYPHTNNIGVGVNPHHKRRNKFIAFVPQAVLLAAILVFFLFFGGVLKSWSFKTIDFLAPERKELEMSRVNLAMLTLLKDNRRSAYPLEISFGGGYLFLDAYFLRGRVDSVRIGDWVLKDDIFLGKIVEVGENFAKFKSLGNLGERSVLRAGENKDILFEATGVGGGELKAELPASFIFQVGDPVWWGEDSQYLAGLVEEVRVRETNPSAEIIIVVPLKIERLSEVEVLIK